MARLTFKTEEVKPLVEHSRQAEEHQAPYGIGVPSPGLFLVKDEGIYLMSNGMPGQMDPNRPEKRLVAYAQGFDPTKRDRFEVFEDARAAVGGDDFIEFVPLSGLSGIEEFLHGENVVIELTESHLAIEVP